MQAVRRCTPAPFLKADRPLSHLSFRGPLPDPDSHTYRRLFGLSLEFRGNPYQKRWIPVKNANLAWGWPERWEGDLCGFVFLCPALRDDGSVPGNSWDRGA